LPESNFLIWHAAKFSLYFEKDCSMRTKNCSICAKMMEIMVGNKTDQVPDHRPS